MKRVIIVHGWDLLPNEHWYPWLKKELEQRGFQVEVPKMPDIERPKIEEWVPFLAKTVGTPDKETYFVGHSIGCQTILRYLESIKEQVGGAVFVAGWFSLQNLESPEIEAIAQPWTNTPIDFKKVQKTTNKFVEFLSDNDPFVPLDNEKKFKHLGAKVIIENGQGHYTKEDGVTQVPQVLSAVLELSR
jgi:hypothetical protein